MNTIKKSLLISSLSLLIGATPVLAAEGDTTRTRAVEAEANRTSNELEAENSVMATERKRVMATERKREAHEKGAEKEAEARAVGAQKKTEVRTRSSNMRSRPDMPSQSRPQSGGGSFRR